MNDRERRRFDMFVRVRQFGLDNAVDFPPASVGAVQFAVVGTEVDQIGTFGGEQAAGFGEARQQFEVKGTARENLPRKCPLLPARRDQWIINSTESATSSECLAARTI